MEEHENYKKRISSIELFRTCAIIAIILIHTNPFEYAFRAFSSGHGTVSLPFVMIYLVITNLTTYAIPFFFVVAGYFLHTKVLSDTQPEKVLLLYWRRLALIGLFWLLFYHLIPTPKYLSFIATNGYLSFLMAELRYIATHPIEMLLCGGANHLWFLPALVVSTAFVALSLMKNMKYVVLAFSSFFYGVHLLRGHYAQTPWGAPVERFFMENMALFERVPISDYLSAFLFVNIGWFLSPRKITAPTTVVLTLILTGIVLSVIEAVYLNTHYSIQTYVPGNLLGTVPIVAGIVVAALAMPELGSGGVMATLGRFSLGVYAVHYILVVYLRLLYPWISHPYIDIILPAAVYLLSLALVSLSARSKWLRYVVV